MCERERSDSHQRALYIKNSSTHVCLLLFFFNYTRRRGETKSALGTHALFSKAALSKMQPKIAPKRAPLPHIAAAHNAISRAWRVYSRILYITQSRACVTSPQRLWENGIYNYHATRPADNNNIHCRREAAATKQFYVL
jgi:hypothetical protein